MTNDRDDDYLWDGSGEPDPEVERLERLLGEYRRRPRRATGFRHAWIPFAIAAGVALWLFVRDATPPGAYAVRGLDGVRFVRAGETLVTPRDGGATVEVGEIGAVEVDPDTRLRVVDTGDVAHRLDLRRGALEASIFAAPRVFQVDTPAGLTVDLGCVYRLEVGDDGRTRLNVRSGRVSFETAEREVFVPSGASSLSVPGEGAGSPVWNDRPDAFRSLVERLDFAAEPERGYAEKLVAFAEPRDSLSLWHMLDTVAPELRRMLAERLAELVPPPAGVTVDAALAGDPFAVARWRDALVDVWTGGDWTWDAPDER